jgi:sugar phosphate isomerase/epimerase
MKLVFCAGTALKVPLAERARAAAAAGFDGISLWADDVERARADGFSDGDLRTLFAQLGLSIAELDGVSAWLPEGGALPAFGRRAEEFFAIAKALGGRSLNVMHIFATPLSIPAAATAFATLCDQAAEHGLLAHLEFLPWSGIPKLEVAWEIVRTAARDNGGLMLDSWHFVRSGGTLETLRTIPGEKIFGVQLSDAPAAPDGVIFDETLRRRRLPGEGDANLSELVRTLDAIGCRAPLGVEVFSEALSALPAAQIAQRAADATRAVLARARAGASS